MITFLGKSWEIHAMFIHHNNIASCKGLKILDNNILDNNALPYTKNYRLYFIVSDCWAGVSSSSVSPELMIIFI